MAAMNVDPVTDLPSILEVETLPITYPGSKPPTELYQDMSNILSSDSTPVIAEKIKELWSRFLEVTVEPAGWQAVWKGGNCSIVEVDYVDYDEHQALVTKQSGSTENTSLIELYPITEQENPAILIEITHLALQKLRFFYEHIWLPWDEDDFAEDWVSTHLETRIRMFYDLQRGAVAPTLAARYKQLIKEGRETREKLNQVENSLGTSDSDRELTEVEALQLMQLNLDLEKQRNEIKLLLDPTLRVLLYRHQIEKRVNSRNRDVPEAFLVWLGGSLDQLRQNLDKVEAVLPPNLQVKCYGSVTEAFECTCAGDTVFLAPGRHKLQNLGGLEYGGRIQGLGTSREDVVIYCDNNDVLLPYQGGLPLFVENVTLSCPDMGILMARGTLNLRNCVLAGQELTKPNAAYQGKGLVALGGNVQMDDVLLRHLAAGVTIRDEAELYTNKSTITSCVIGLEMDESALCEWKDVRVHSCKEYGICVTMNEPTAEGELCKTGSVALLQTIPALRFSLEDVKMEDQGLKDVVLSFPRSANNSANSSASGDSGCVFQPGKLQFVNGVATPTSSVPRSARRLTRSSSWSHGLFSDSL